MSFKWNRRNVLVTGATGLLGSHLSAELIKRSANLVTLVRDFVPESKLYKDGFERKVNTVRGNLEDYALMERVLNEYEIEAVFHLAAQTIVPIANNNPVSTFESNIKGTWVLLEACRRNKKVARIIVASSDKAYGDQKILPYSEEAPLMGRHPYDVSKSCADLISRMYFSHYALPVCVTRCGNLYGGGDLNFNRIIPGTIRSALNDEASVIRSDGKYVRDYFYVKDAVDAYIHLAENMDRTDVIGEAFNFSNETPMTVIEIATQVLAAMGKEDLKPVILNEVQGGEILEQYLAAEKARKLLNWKAKYSVAEGLTDTIEWYKKNL